MPPVPQQYGGYQSFRTSPTNMPAPPQQMFIPNNYVKSQVNAPSFFGNSDSQRVQEFHPTNSQLPTLNRTASYQDYLQVPVETKKISVRRDSEEFNSDSTDCSSPNKCQKQYECQADRKKFVKEYKRKQKTEMCKNWDMYGNCKWQDKCSYAHGKHELVKKTHLPKNFMTKACEQFHKEQFCAYGKRCQFMHSERDIYGQQQYATVIRENTRLAKAKMDKIEIEQDNLAQVYINVFSATKSRLSCFDNITGTENEYDFTNEITSAPQVDILSKNSSSGSDSDKLFEDFGDIAMKQIPMMTKKTKSKRIVRETVPQENLTSAPASKNFFVQFNQKQQQNMKTGKEYNFAKKNDFYAGDVADFSEQNFLMPCVASN